MTRNDEGFLLEDNRGWPRRSCVGAAKPQEALLRRKHSAAIQRTVGASIAPLKPKGCVMNWCLASGGFFILFLSGCGSPPGTTSPTPEKPAHAPGEGGERSAGAKTPFSVRGYLGTSITKVLEEADRAEAFRLGKLGGEALPELPKLGPYPILKQSAPLDATFAARLRDLILDPKSYNSGPAKACKPRYGVAFRLVGKSGEPVLAFFCFECGDFFVLHEKTGEKLKAVDFENNKAAFLALAREAFPDDPALKLGKDVE